MNGVVLICCMDFLGCVYWEEGLFLIEFSLNCMLANGLYPVPAGISCPRMMFSLSPRRWSVLAETEALLSTLVVSWKEASDIQLDVLRAACVMPCNFG